MYAFTKVALEHRSVIIPFVAGNFGWCDLTFQGALQEPFVDLCLPVGTEPLQQMIMLPCHAVQNV
jgi:hypothetical protein